MVEPVARNARVRGRTWWLRIAAILAFLSLTAQLWRLQIVEGRAFQQEAAANHLRIGVVPPPRGLIYDRRGRVLAENAPVFSVAIVPADLPAGREREVYGRLAGLLGTDAGAVGAAVAALGYESDPFTPRRVRSNLDRETVLRLEEHHLELPGVVVNVESTRSYPEGPIFAHILGYTLAISEQLLGREEYQRRLSQERYTISDKVGASGLERLYERDLRGWPGRRLTQVDVTGRTVRELSEEPPRPGNHLVLTIDRDLQREVAALLQEEMGDAPGAVAVVMNPNDGEVLALVSLPSFDNNLFASGISAEELGALLADPGAPLFDRAVGGLYPPGSLFKLVTALAALQEGVASPATRILCKGYLDVTSDYDPTTTMRLKDQAAHGEQDLVQAIANSCDVFFYLLGGGDADFTGLGAERLVRYARLLGYGEPTGIDAGGEEAGLVPTREWKLQAKQDEWLSGDTYALAAGRGDLLATPLQVANVTNAIANGGTLYRPRLVREVLDSDGNLLEQRPAAVLRQVPIDAAHWALVREGMAAALDTPALRSLLPEGVRVAGRWSTVERPIASGDEDKGRTQAWFTGFAPVDNPQVSVTVFLERGDGLRDAAPLALRILARSLSALEAP